MKKPYIIQVIIGGLFVSAGISKMIFVNTTALEMIQYKILPEILSLPVAIGICMAEMVLGFMLMMGWKFKFTAISLSGLLVIFELAKISTIVRHIDLATCACLGTFLKLPVWASSILGGLLLAGIIYAARGRVKDGRSIHQD